MIRTICLLLLGLGFFVQISNICWADAPWDTPQDQVASEYDLVILGAGPAGLTAAVSAIQHGLDPHRVLVIEKRDIASYASRQRVVVLDGTSLQILESNGVKLPGTPIRTMVAHLSNGQRRYYPSSGSWKSAIGSLFGGRSLDRNASLGEIERTLLNSYSGELGGDAVFGHSAVILDEPGSGPRKILWQDRIISAGLIVTAEGANSSLAQTVPSIPIAEDSTSNFLTYDFQYSPNTEIQRGDIMALSDAKGGFMVYAFVGNGVASVNMMLPRRLSVEDLKGDQYTYTFYADKVFQAAQRFGLTPPSDQVGALHSGLLTMRDRSQIGNVVFIGDTLRKVDAIGGTGVNTAILDGEAIGEYFANMSRYGESRAKQTLSETLIFNTETAFEYSLFFREMARMGLNNPRLLELTQGLGLSSRTGDGLLDLSKNVFAIGYGLFAGRDRQAATIERGLRASGGPPMPFKSAQRQDQIGDVHPKRTLRPDYDLLASAQQNEKLTSACISALTKKRRAK